MISQNESGTYSQSILYIIYIYVQAAKRQTQRHTRMLVSKSSPYWIALSICASKIPTLSGSSRSSPAKFTKLNSSICV